MSWKLELDNGGYLSAKSCPGEWPATDTEKGQQHLNF